MSDADARESSHVHWLLLGSLSSSPSGRRFILDADSFAETFAAANMTAKLDLGPALGAGGAHEVEISFAKLRQYSMKHVLASLPVLGKLRELADSLGKPSSKRPSDEATIARVVNLIGDGDLAAELRKAFAGEETPPAEAPAKDPEPAAGSGESASLVDELLESHDTKQVASKQAVDSFIAAIRGKPALTGGKPTPANRRARELLETAVFGSVNAVLNHEAVIGPESLWRGLNLVVKNAPRKSGMLVEIVDVAPEGIEDAMRACLDDEPMNRPDAFFCFDRIEDVARMQSIASLAEDMHAPVVMGVGPSFFGVEDPEDIISHMRAAEPDASAVFPEDYAQLRADEVSRWLALTTNDVVVASEGAGAARRTVLGSSVFALAAMIASSFHHTGGFARILGKEGALKAPGLREVQKGREAGSTVPTAAFLSIRAQAELAENGFIGLGSGRNTDMVALSDVRTVRGSKDAVILPAQILTGRLVRFGLWVADQVPAGSTKDEVAKLFKDAATVFLFPGLSSGAELHAGVINEGQGNMIRLVANVSPRLAGAPFEVGFDLPIAVTLAD